MEPKNRLCIVEHLYFQAVGEQPLELSNLRKSYNLQSIEQPYQRRNWRITGNAQPIDFGWVEDPGVVSIENTEGSFFSKNPTAEELAEVNSRVVGIFLANYVPTGICPMLFEIPPQASCRLMLNKHLPWQIVCLNDKTACVTITVCPK